MASDIEIQAREILKVRSRLNELYEKHTGQPLETIEKIMDRDTFMDVDQALKFGVVDSVLHQRQNTDDGDSEGEGPVE